MPLCSWQKMAWYLLGTGVLLSHSDSLYVATARHVYRDLNSRALFPIPTPLRGALPRVQCHVVLGQFGHRFRGVVWKTSPGAWLVDPTVSKGGPWSSTMMSRHPLAARWYAALRPTIPRR